MLAAGDLDPTFGTAGLVQTVVATEDFARQGDIQFVGGEEKTVILADTSAGQRLIRYNSDGSLDSAFGGDQGVELSQLPNAIKSIAAQGDKLLALGHVNSSSPHQGYPFVLRLSENGLPDPTFGTGGILTTDILSDSFFQFAVPIGMPARIVAQGDKLMIAATGIADSTLAGKFDLILARYTSTGELDTTFGNEGKIVLDGHDIDFVTGMEVDGDSVAISMDSFNPFTGEGFSNLIRISGNGLDEQFASSGMLAIPFNNQVFDGIDDRNDWTTQADKTLVATTVFQENDPENPDDDANVFALKQYDATGSLDESFGVDGVALLDGLGPGRMAYDVYGGIILIQGLSAVRIKPNGQLDTSFGTDGFAPFFEATTDQFAGLELQSDGKVVLFGSRSAESADIILSRLLGSEDGDGDGIANVVDTQPTLLSNDFSDVGINGGATAGAIISRGDQVLSVVDAVSPADGVLISATVEGGATPATVSIEGRADLTISPGDQVIATHGSVILNVLAGTVEATYTADSGEVVAAASLTAGSNLTFKPDSGTFIAAADSQVTVEVTLIGAADQIATASLTAGAGIVFDPEAFVVTAPASNTQPVSVVVADGQVLNVNPGQTVSVSVQSVTIDIQPTSLNLDSNGLLTVLIIGATNFNVSQINVGSVRFAGASATQFLLLDANHDGKLDLQLKFRRQDTILDQIYSQLLLDDRNADGILDSTRETANIDVTGRTLDGALFSGSDQITLFRTGKSLRNLLAELFGA